MVTCAVTIDKRGVAARAGRRWGFPKWRPRPEYAYAVSSRMNRISRILIHCSPARDNIMNSIGISTSPISSSKGMRAIHAGTCKKAETCLSGQQRHRSYPKREVQDDLEIGTCYHIGLLELDPVTLWLSGDFAPVLDSYALSGSTCARVMTAWVTQCDQSICDREATQCRQDHCSLVDQQMGGKTSEERRLAAKVRNNYMVLNYLARNTIYSA